MHAGAVCDLDLPPAVGALWLPGRVVWTRLQGTEQTLEGKQRSPYKSRIEFTGVTPVQQVALTHALATFRAAQVGLGAMPTLPPDTAPDGVQGSST